MYFVFDKENWDFDFFNTEQEAQFAVAKILSRYHDEAHDEGWPGYFEKKIGYGKVVMHNIEKLIHDKKDYKDEEWEDEGYSLDHDKILDYKLERATEI